MRRFFVFLILISRANYIQRRNLTIGRERRERVSQLAWCGEGCFDSRRRVNSTVRAPLKGSVRQNNAGGRHGSISEEAATGGRRDIQGM